MKKRFAFFLFLSLVFAVCNTSLAKNYYVSTTGSDSNKGYLIDSAFLTMKKALGKSDIDTIFVRGGTYFLTGDSTISVNKSGTAIKPLVIMSYADERPVFDGSLLNAAKKCINVTGQYWHIIGLHFTHAMDNGMYITGSNNVIERCSFFENTDSGLQLSGGASSNQIINCDSYYNKDATSENADGFACKLDVGTGNSFKGCRSWQNSDDGWDGYMRPSDNINTTLENCWSFQNGYLKTGSISGANGDGNGFKLGGGDDVNGVSNGANLRHNMTLTNCLSFDNRKRGYDQNNNAGTMILYNCGAYRNQSQNYNLGGHALAAGSEIIVKNCISYLPKSGNSFSTTPSTYQNNSWQSPFTVAADDFVSLDTTGMRGPRKADGSLPDVNFMHLAAGSDLIDGGQDVGLPYNGSKPDLGAFETGTLALISYTFTGNGNWSDAANWLNSTVPPASLPPGSQITINPVDGGECILNTAYTVSPGVIFTVTSGKNFRVAQ